MTYAPETCGDRIAAICDDLHWYGPGRPATAGAGVDPVFTARRGSHVSVCGRAKS